MNDISRSRMLAIAVTVILAPAGARSSGDGMEDCPMHAQHRARAAQQQREREDEGMGFSQERTTHHFLLASDGGTIQVTANAADDRTTIEQVHRHLEHIARAFRAGDFTTPASVHGQVPPGVPAMRQLRAEISYAYQSRPDGAVVVIRSRNPEAVAAVQEFLRFQVREHKTGDPIR
jgi:hypothetical protein